MDGAAAGSRLTCVPQTGLFHGRFRAGWTLVLDVVAAPGSRVGGGSTAYPGIKLGPGTLSAWFGKPPGL